MDVALRGDRAQHADVAGRQPGQPEQRQPLRQIDQRGLVGQPRARALDALGRSGLPDRRAQPSPQLGLPAGVLTLSPRANEVGTVQRVAVEQVGEVPDRAVAAPARVLAQVVREVVQPRLGEARVNDREQRPHRPFRPPRIGVGIDARRDRHRVGHEPVRGREVDVRAHAVRAPRLGAEPGREPLPEPALDPARGDADDLARERIRQRIGEQRAERVDEMIGPFGPVDVKHGAAAPNGSLPAPLARPHSSVLGAAGSSPACARRSSLRRALDHRPLRVSGSSRSR